MNEAQWISFLSAIPQYPVMGYFIADFINAKRKFFLTLLFTVILTALSALSVPDSQIQMMLMWAVMIILPLVFCRISRIRTLLYLLISIIIMNLVSAPPSLLLLHLYPDAVTSIDFPPQVLLSVRIIMFPMLILSWYFSNRLCRKLFGMSHTDSLRQYLPFLCAETVIIVLDQIVYIFDLKFNYAGYLLSTIIVAAFLLIDIMLVRTVKRLNHAHETELRLQQTESLLHGQQEVFSMLQSQILSLQTIRHDTANQLSTISYLIETGAYDKALAQLSAFRKTTSDLGTVQYTGNTVIDAILNIKSESIRDTEIRFSFVGTLPSSLSLDPVVLCSVVSNLLDNAIRACRELDPANYPAVIRFSSAIRHNFLIFRCVNPCSVSASVPDESASEMPAPYDEHGWGIHILRKSAELYDGTTAFYVNDGYFTAEIQLNLSSCSEEE